MSSTQSNKLSSSSSSSSELDGIVSALADAANDKNETVQRTVSASIVSLGRKMPVPVLCICSSYLEIHAKLPIKHRTRLLVAMKKICDEAQHLTNDLLLQLIKQTAAHLTSDEGKLLNSTPQYSVPPRDPTSEWKNAMSELLVSLGKKSCQDVMEVLLLNFQPGAMPNAVVLQTLANLAVANVYHMVPFLKTVVCTSLEMVTDIHQDNLKWMFAFTFARFSDSLLEYVANIDRAPDQSVKTELFQSEFCSVYDSLLNWLQTKDSKLRLMVLEAVGSVSHLISREKFEQRLSRVISSYLSSYKRHSDLDAISQSFYMFIEGGFKHNSSLLDAQMDGVMRTLFSQVCVIPNYSDQSQAKNHNEVLRCFAVVAKRHPRLMNDFLASQLEINAEKPRIGSLTILRHLINSTGKEFDDNVPCLVEYLKGVVTDGSDKVKRLLAQLIASIAGNGYLEQDSSEIFLEFLIYHSGTSNETDEEKLVLQSTCENAINLICTTVPNIEIIVWPHILQYILPGKYINSIGTVCKNASFLATKTCSAERLSWQLDYSVLSNVKQPLMLVARLFVLASFLNEERLSVLQLMKCLAPTFHKDLVAAWDLRIPQLLSTLTSAEAMNISDWDEMLLGFLGESLNNVDEEEWWKSLGRCFTEQINLYDDCPVGKAFLFRCLGEIVKKVNDNYYVTQHLELVFTSTQHSNLIERKGCAQAFGRSAVTHLDTVLSLLESLLKSDSSRKNNTGLFSFFWDSKTDLQQEAFKSTVLVSYGVVSSMAPINSLSLKLETSIIGVILPHFQMAKDCDMKCSLLEAVALLLEALHPNRFAGLLTDAVRKDLLQYITDLIAAADTCQIICLSLRGINSLLQLNPHLAQQDWENSIRICLEKVYSLTMNEKNSKENISSALDYLNELLVTFLRDGQGLDNLHYFSNCLNKWLSSSKVQERMRSLKSLENLLKYYEESFAIIEKRRIGRSPVGALLARCIPRCCDDDCEIRQLSITVICRTVRISALLEGFSSDYYKHSLSELEAVRLQLSEPNEASALFAATSCLGEVITATIANRQLVPFLNVLFDGLLDPVSDGSAGVCVVFNTVIQKRGSELLDEVTCLLESLHRQLRAIDYINTRKWAIRIVRSIAKNHLIPVVNFLLACPLPYDSVVVESWRVLAQTPSLGSEVLNLLLPELDHRSNLTQYHPDPRNKKNSLLWASSHSLSVLCALRELFHQAEMEEAARIQFSHLFVSVMLVCGLFVTAYPPPPPDFNRTNKAHWPTFSMLDHIDNNYPIRIGTDVFRSFLLCVGHDRLLQDASNWGCWLQFEKESSFPDSVTFLARCLCKYAPEYLAECISALNFALTSSRVSFRIVATAFFAELVRQGCEGDGALLEIVTNNLMTNLVDSSKTVRKLCIRGLGYLGEIGPKKVDKYCAVALPAMLAGLDDKDDSEGDIRLEAMRGLSSVVSAVGEEFVIPVLIHIVLSLRSCFEHSRSEIRAMSFKLMGDLARFGNQKEAECDSRAFVEQIHNNLVPTLLHLNDEDDEVVKSCKSCLRNVVPLLDCKQLDLMCQKHLLFDSRLHYGEFMNDLSKHLVNQFVDQIPLYVASNVQHFKSSWPFIRANAAMLVGYLLRDLPEDKRNQISTKSVCSALILLLKSEDAVVRIQAAEALSHLYRY